MEVLSWQLHGEVEVNRANPQLGYVSQLRFKRRSLPEYVYAKHRRNLKYYSVIYFE
jgi:hypothetical protein